MDEKLEKIINNYHNYQRNIYNAIFNSTSFNEFTKFSSAGKRKEMIDLIKNLPQVSNIKISDCFAEKNDNFTERELKNLHNNLVLGKLNRALLSATFKSINYFQILMERIRHFYKLKRTEDCFEDIQFFKNSCEQDLFKEFVIECYLIENHLYKLKNEPENARNALNKAMTELNDLAQKISVNEDIKLIKQKLLQMFLQKLKKEKEHCDGFLSGRKKKIAIPKLYGQAHNLLKCCSDSISLSYDEKRGMHLYAIKDIPVGSAIIVDYPFAFSFNQDNLHRNCLSCCTSLDIENSRIIPCFQCQRVIFCSEECRSSSWRLHKYECAIFSIFCTKESNSHFLLAYRATVSKLMTESEKLNDEFFIIENNKHLNERIQSLECVYDPLDYKTVSNLQDHCAETSPKENLIFAVRSVFFAKCMSFVLNKFGITLKEEEESVISAAFMRFVQIINCNAYEIVENEYNIEKQVWEPRNIGGAIYATVSLTNHSCYPNVIRHSYPQGLVVVRTTRKVKKGDEILDNYGPHFLTSPTNERQKYLFKKYHFECHCDACENNWSCDLIKDMKLKCSNCSKPYDCLKTKCSFCQKKINNSNLKKSLLKSEKNRFSAVSIMLEGNYEEALKILEKHVSFCDSILVAPNLEVIKSQQTMIQCYNGLSCMESKVK